MCFRCYRVLNFFFQITKLDLLFIYLFFSIICDKPISDLLAVVDLIYSLREMPCKILIIPSCTSF